jgi:hypothetical protein
MGGEKFKGIQAWPAESGDERLHQQILDARNRVMTLHMS